MSHWAELDENNVVVQVVVGDNDDPNGDEGYQWLLDNLGGRWVQTSYNANFRHKYAGIGDTYNEELDIFHVSQPFPSWTFNETTYQWDPPTPRPPETDTHWFKWNEETQGWDETPFLN